MIKRNTTCYKTAGTETFRLASASLFGEIGSNLQNLEKSSRALYIPDAGKIFVQVDQAGAEALIVAYLCKDGPLRELFKHGIKPHVYVALKLFHPQLRKEKPELKSVIDAALECPINKLKTLTDWKKLENLIKDTDNWEYSKRYYYLAKQTCHSGNYRIGAAMFQMNLLAKSGGKVVISKNDSEYFIGHYTGAIFPQIPAWWMDTESQVTKNKVLRNLQGFPRIITEPINEKTFKELYAFVPQSTVGTITNMAVTDLYHYIAGNKLQWDILANTHDSYMTQCPVGEEVECARVMKLFIERELKSPSGELFRMRSEAQAGYNWAPYKKGKNEKGLVEL